MPVASLEGAVREGRSGGDKLSWGGVGVPGKIRRAVLVVAVAVFAGAEAFLGRGGRQVVVRAVGREDVACVTVAGGRRMGRARGETALAFAPVPLRRVEEREARREVIVGEERKVLASAAAPGLTETVGGSDGTGKSEVRRSLLVLASAMFVVGAALAAAETAITTLWPWKVRELAEKEGDTSPFAMLESDLTRFLTTILVTTTSATVLSTAIATEVAGDIFGAAAVGYVTAGMTVFFLFFGEILPKALAVHAPTKVARVMVPVISTLSVIVYPVGKLLAWFSTQILRLLKLPMENDATVSEEELRLIVAGADRSGSIEKYESQIIQNVLDLEDTDVREVMRPRVDVVALAESSNLAELLALESQSHYSRMPVYEKNIDNIVGVAMAKSLLRYLNGDASLLQSTKVSEIMDPAFFVPESMSVWIVLEEMRKRRLHMAIVVDEYGGTAGLVTLEDILEEVVGEIYDEDDDYEAQAQSIDMDDDGKYVLDGQTDLDKVEQTLNLNLSAEDLDAYGTISGFLCGRMEGIPDVGDEIVFNKVRFTVSEADDRRIVTLRAEVLSDDEVIRVVENDISAQRRAENSGGNESTSRNGVESTSESNMQESSGPSSTISPGQSDEFPFGKFFSNVAGANTKKNSIKETNKETNARDGSTNSMHGLNSSGNNPNKS